MNRGRRAALAALALGPWVAVAEGRKRVAIVNWGDPGDWKSWTDSFVRGLAHHGFVDGRNVEVLMVGIAGEGLGRGPEETARKVERQALPLRPDVIVTDGEVMTLCVSMATRTVPIVTEVSDPVGAGYAKSIARPGGNVTGLSGGVEETAIKTVELVRQLLPRAKRLGIITDPRPAATQLTAPFLRAAQKAGIEPVPVVSKRFEEQLAGLRALPSQGVPACLNVAGDGHPRQFASEALAIGLPIFATDYHVVRFGYVGAYSAYEPAAAERLAAIAARVLRGANPAELPFQFPERFRLAINRGVAERLKLKVSPELLLRADVVID